MRIGATKVESNGSLWWLDDDAHEYLRLPKQEGPRWSPPDNDWGGPESGELQDMVWHPMHSWSIIDLGFQRRLTIWIDDPLTTSKPLCVSAPLPADVTT